MWHPTFTWLAFWFSRPDADGSGRFAYNIQVRTEAPWSLQLFLFYLQYSWSFVSCSDCSTQDFFIISLPNISMPFRWKGSWQSLAMLGIKTWVLFKAPDRSAPVLVAVEVVWTQDVAMKILQALKTATCEGETLVQLRMWDDLGITRVERQIHLRLLQRHLRLHRPLLKAPSHGCSHSYRKQHKKAYASAPWNPCISKDTITRFDVLRSVNPMMWTAPPFGMRRIGSVGASKDGKQHHGVQQICDSS